MATRFRTIRKPLSIGMSVHQFVSLAGAPFDVEAYSRLKFGSNAVAKMFAYEMADLFYLQYGDILRDMPCVVVPAPSTTVPVAATLMSLHFMNRLNSHCVHRGWDIVEWSMIHRKMSYNNNYSDLSRDERRALMSNDGYDLNTAFLRGKFIIFIDDCRITGTHEEKITSLLAREKMTNDHAFVCYTSYVGDDPSIESRLNHTFIKDAADLVELAREPNHQITTRAIRLLLEYPEDSFEDLLDRAPGGFVESAYHAAMTKGYHHHYPATFAHLARRMGMGRPQAV